MRPSEIMMLTLGVIIALAGLAMGLGVIFDHTGGFFWFYWIAPLLAFGFGAILINLAVNYWRQVGRLEARGRRVE